MRLRRVEPVLRRSLRRTGRVPPGGRILVAVSGGADSTALLLGLARLRAELGYQLHAAHLHHGLRGAEADRDLAFVRALCRRLGVRLSCARWDARARMRARGLSGQDGLRRLRREFLTAVARRVEADRIATAHTADDQLETLLLRLTRGTGLAGLGGIRERSGPWIRPLLQISRDQVEADLRAAGERWREDQSNADPRYARNRARHRVIPAWLEALAAGSEPEARGALARRVEAALGELRAARRCLEREAGQALERATRPSDPSTSRGPGRPTLALDCDTLRSYPVVIRRLLLGLAWKRLGAGLGLTGRHLDALLAVCRSGRAGRLELPGAMIAARSGDRLQILARERGIEAGGPSAPPWPRRLAVPGRSRWRGREFRTAWLAGSLARDRLASKPAGDEFFAADGLQGGLEVRVGRTDEWFVPFGRRRPRRLGDFVRRQQLSSEARAHPVVLADHRGILWVVGVRRSARATLTPDTRRALWIHTEPR